MTPGNSLASLGQPVVHSIRHLPQKTGLWPNEAFYAVLHVSYLDKACIPAEDLLDLKQKNPHRS